MERKCKGIVERESVKKSVKANETGVSKKQMKLNGAFYQGANARLAFGINSFSHLKIDIESVWLPHRNHHLI